MKQTIKELFTAHYIPETGEVKNCRVHSLAWFHEMRHHEQFQNEAVRWFSFATNYIALISTFFFIWVGIIYEEIDFRAVTILTGLIFLPYSITVFILETDAWIVSVHRFIKNKKSIW